MTKSFLTICFIVLFSQLSWSQRQLGAKLGIGLSEIIHQNAYPGSENKISPGFSGQFGLAYRANPGKFSSIFLEFTVNQLESKSEYLWASNFGANGQPIGYTKDTYNDHYTSVMASFYYGVRVDKVCLTIGPWLARGIRYTSSYTHETAVVDGYYSSQSSLRTFQVTEDTWMGLRTGVIYALSDRYFVETHYLIGNKIISSANSLSNSGDDVSHQLIVGFRYNFVVADPAEPRAERKRPHPRSRRARE